ncbi:MAG: sigma-70 family RNA polymerase sigma factor [Pseudomonadota bacterium]
MSTSATSDIRRQLDVLVRRERGRLIADLVAYLGPARLNLAEDVAQDAIVAALQTWPYRGLPDKPSAWLARVARNKAIDRLRRENRETPYLDTLDRRESAETDNLFAARVEDPELRLIVLCCNDELAELDQVALTLKAVSGFTAREISGLFLMKEAAMGQRLARAKRKLRDVHASSTHGIDAAPSRFRLSQRLRAILKAVYLMFSLGYAPPAGGDVVRRDVAMEAVRIARELAYSKATAAPDALALAALLCLQASRLDARSTPDGALVLLRHQERSRWNQDLIREGLTLLRKAQNTDRVSRYHIEAGIAAVHAASPSWAACDWHAIVRLYDQLGAIADSPIVAINAAVARAMAGNAEEALETLNELQRQPALARYAPYYIARAEVLCQLGHDAEAMGDFEKALECDVSTPVLQHLEQRLASCV